MSNLKIHRLSTGVDFGAILFSWYILCIMISPRRARRMQKIMQRKLMQDLRDKTKNMLKPKPRFMPDWLWRKLIYMLLDLPQE